MSSRLIFMCRHAHKDESDHLDARGVTQSHALGRKLIDLMDRRDLKYICIITSSLDRAKETGAILKFHLAGRQPSG
jgi:phosphohistidine phosphatase SixA